MELAGFVNSHDPELRDNFGHEILANWIHRSGKFTTRELDALRGAFLPFVLAGMGELETDTVFSHSFALLNLKELAVADLNTPFLTEATFDELFESAVNAFAAEKDTRGYVMGKGWAHATAHGADLLRMLALNNKLHVPQQSRLITAIANRARSAGSVFLWGEDARMSAALDSVASRADVDITEFDNWFAALRAENRQLWRNAFAPFAYVRVRAQVNTLAQFAALVARQNTPTFAAKLRETLHATLSAVN